MKYLFVDSALFYSEEISLSLILLKNENQYEYIGSQNEMYTTEQIHSLALKYNVDGIVVDESNGEFSTVKFLRDSCDDIYLYSFAENKEFAHKSILKLEDDIFSGKIKLDDLLTFIYSTLKDDYEFINDSFLVRHNHFKAPKLMFNLLRDLEFFNNFLDREKVRLKINEEIL